MSSGVFALLATVLAVAPAAQEDVEHPRDIKTVPLPPYVPEAPQVFATEGGPRILVLESHELPLVDGILLLDSGTVHDPDDRAGLVEMMADSLREGGSKTRSGAELDRWLDAHAATLTVEADRESLRISFSCLAENTKELVDAVCDLLVNPAYPEDVVDKSRARLLTRIARRSDDVGALADSVVLAVAYGPDSPYSRDPEPESLEAIRAEELAEFHRSHLGRGRVVVGVTGDVSAEAIAQQFTDALSKWNATGEPHEAALPAFIQPRTRKVYLVDTPGIAQTELRLVGPGVRRLHPDYSALYYWSHAIGIGGSTNRMLVRVRTELGLAFTVGAFYRANWRRAGRFEAFCSTRNESVGQALGAMIEVLEESTGELPPEELEAVRARMTNSLVFEFDREREVLERALLLDYHGYPADFWTKHAERLRALDAKTLAEAVGRHLATDRMVIVAVGPAERIADQLAGFGEVERIDDRGRSLTPEEPRVVTKMFAALGGRERWAGALNFHREDTITIPNPNGDDLVIERRQWQTMTPRQSRNEVDFTGQPTRTSVLGPDVCFSRAGDDIVDLPDAQCATMRTQADGNLYSLLHLLAKKAVHPVAIPDTKNLRIDFASGLTCVLHLGDDDRPIALETAVGQTNERYLFESWAEAEDGTPYVDRMTDAVRGTIAETTAFALDVELDEKTFRDPRK